MTFWVWINIYPKFSSFWPGLDGNLLSFFPWDSARYDKIIFLLVQQLNIKIFFMQGCRLGGKYANLDLNCRKCEVWLWSRDGNGFLEKGQAYVSLDQSKLQNIAMVCDNGRSFLPGYCCSFHLPVDCIGSWKPHKMSHKRTSVWCSLSTSCRLIFIK